MKGILNVSKPQDWTSFDVVNYLKKLLNTKHIGHLGTLDPMATGVLPVTIGSATKLFDLFLKKEKTYIAKFEFGYMTDTLDATGQIIKSTQKTPTFDEIKAILPKFIGNINQVPPIYSAKKINGRKAYDIARSGQTIELKPNNIFIKNLEILDYKTNITTLGSLSKKLAPKGAEDMRDSDFSSLGLLSKRLSMKSTGDIKISELTLKIECGAGTYIRAIGRDIANELNTLATMTELTRTEVGIFKLEDSINIKFLTKEEIVSKILPTDITFNHLPIINDETLVFRLLNGQTVITTLDNGEYRVYKDNEFLALARVENSKFKMTKYFG